MKVGMPLISMSRAGRHWTQLACALPPGADGHAHVLLQVPAKWDNILKQSQVYKEIALESSAAKTPPKTPPRPASKA